MKETVNFDKFLLKVTDHNGDVIEVIVEADNANLAMLRFLEHYSGSQNIRKIEASLPLLIM